MEDYRLKDDFLKLSWSCFCVICQRPCQHFDLCDKCSVELPWLTHLPSLKSQYVNEIQSLFAFEEPHITQWIHRLKYSQKIQYTELFARLILQYLTINPVIEVIIPVPLHRQRYCNRGFNQATLIAKRLSKITTIAVDEDILLRHKNTQSQISLTPNQRLKNVKNAFSIANKSMDYSGVLLIDDVYTTGATLNEMAETINKFNKHTIIEAITVARAL